jgi:hypothetical protein
MMYITSTRRYGLTISLCGLLRTPGLYLPAQFTFCDLINGVDIPSDDLLVQFGDIVHNVHVEKSMVAWELEELEVAVSQAQDERQADSDDESEWEIERMPPAPL